METDDEKTQKKLQDFLQKSFSEGFVFIGDIILKNPIKFDEDEEGFLNTLVLELSQRGFTVEGNY